MLWWIMGFWLASGAVIPVLWLLSMASRRVFVRNIEAEQRRAATPASDAAQLQGHHPDGMRVAPSHIGQYVLSGLATLGALILLFVSSFSDSSVTMRDLPSAAAVAHAPVAPAAVAETRPLQSPASAALSPAAQLSAAPAPSDTDTVDGEASRGLLHEAPPLGDAEHIALIKSRTGNGGEHASDDAGRPTAAALPQAPAADALLTAPLFPGVPGAERGRGTRRAHGPSVRPYATTPLSHGTWLFPPAPHAGANS